MATEEVLFTFRFEEGGGAAGAPVGGGIPTDAAADQAARAARGAEPAAGEEIPTEPGTAGGAVAAVRGGITAGAIAAAATFAAAALAVKGLVSAIDDTTNRLEEFSPALSVEQAQSEALRTIQTIRQAQEIGPTLAEFQRERAALARELSDIKIAILKEVVPIATNILKGINNIGKIAEDEEKKENRPALLLSQIPFISEENPGLLRGFLTDELDLEQFGFLNLEPRLGFGQ